MTEKTEELNEEAYRRGIPVRFSYLPAVDSFLAEFTVGETLLNTALESYDLARGFMLGIGFAIRWGVK